MAAQTNEKIIKSFFVMSSKNTFLEGMHLIPIILEGNKCNILFSIYNEINNVKIFLIGQSKGKKLFVPILQIRLSLNVIFDWTV